MKILLDTHLLLWAAGQPARLSPKACKLISDPQNQPMFSAAGLWEIAMKYGLGRSDFQVDARQLRRELLDNRYLELAISGFHVVAVEGPAPIHKDPFDRLLVAQAVVAGITLLSADPVVASYQGPVVRVQVPDSQGSRILGNTNLKHTSWLKSAASGGGENVRNLPAMILILTAEARFAGVASDAVCWPIFTPVIQKCLR